MARDKSRRKDRSSRPVDPSADQNVHKDADQNDPSNPPLPTQPNSTINLVQRAKQGEPHALSWLFERYYPRVRKVVRRALGDDLRKHLESVDILQETFTQAAQGFEKFEHYDDNSLINYLSKIAQRKIFEELQRVHTAKRDPKREVHIDAADGAGGVDVPTRDPTPSQDYSVQEVSHVLRDCIRELPEDHQISIVMRYFCHLEYAQIATATGRPSPDAARMVHRTALKELERLLRAQGITSWV